MGIREVAGAVGAVVFAAAVMFGPGVLRDDPAPASEQTPTAEPTDQSYLDLVSGDDCELPDLGPSPSPGTYAVLCEAPSGTTLGREPGPHLEPTPGAGGQPIEVMPQ